jgi:hypothetical protein
MQCQAPELEPSDLRQGPTGTISRSDLTVQAGSGEIKWVHTFRNRCNPIVPAQKVDGLLTYNHNLGLMQ